MSWPSKRLLKYITEGYRLRLVLVALFITVSALAGVIGSMFLRVLIDDYIAPLTAMESPVFTELFKAIVLMGAIYLTGVVSTYVYNRCMLVIAQGVQRRIRNELFSKMQRLPIGYFDSNSFGDIMSRFTNDVDTLRQMISQSIPMVFSSLVSMLFVLCGMLSTSIPLTILVLAMVGVMIISVRAVARKSGKFFTGQQRDLGEVNGFIEEMMNGQKVVKVFCYEDEAKERFAERNEKLFESVYNANKYSSVLMPVMMNLSNLSYILTAIAGGAMLLSGAGGLTLGAVVSFLQLTKTFNHPVSQIAQQVNPIITALAGAERVFAMMDEEPETDEGTLELSEVKGDVRLHDVDFSYDGETPVLHKVSLFAKPGQKLAFVGATGAGKTTITNLINRFYDIDGGEILYDGVNISSIKKSALRRSLGIVLQDVNLFTGTVMENIRYGKLDATDEEVIAAAKLAGADSFISRLPEGYNTLLSGDGSGLSQGQRQLISIARAAVADPPVMILDEATSSIDTRTEKLVQRGMDALMENRTVLVIAHRLSTIQNAKAIMVLDKGRVIERGSHDELLELKGRYYQLYTGSFESADDFESA